MTRAAWESPPDSAFSGPALVVSNQFRAIAQKFLFLRILNNLVDVRHRSPTLLFEGSRRGIRPLASTMLPRSAAIEIWKQIENRAPPRVEADQTHRRSRRGKGVRIFRVGRRTAGFWPASAAERAQGLRRSIQRRVSVAARNADQLHRDGL